MILCYSYADNSDGLFWYIKFNRVYVCFTIAVYDSELDRDIRSGVLKPHYVTNMVIVSML